MKIEKERNMRLEDKKQCGSERAKNESEEKDVCV